MEMRLHGFFLSFYYVYGPNVFFFFVFKTGQGFRTTRTIILYYTIIVTLDGLQREDSLTYVSILVCIVYF